jgi:3-hydroxyacyl-CoA dehydrogenase
MIKSEAGQQTGQNTDFQTAILGGGLIGASWAALFLSRGLRVTIADPQPEAEAFCRQLIQDAWPDLAALADIPPAPDWNALHFTTAIPEACNNADLVQDCGPDRLDTKRAMLAEAETVLSKDAIFASSTSSLMASDLQQGARHPGRILVAHPMNPPHLVPLVELVAGKHTQPNVMSAARHFYENLDRVVITAQKERPGHIANRLTAALYREAVNIVAEGIATVGDVDRAISYGPGMRWALMGPHLIYHLGGGTGGYRHYLEHLGPTQEDRWQDLGTPKLTPELMEQLAQELEQELAGIDSGQLRNHRDAALVALTQLKQNLPV